MKMHYHGWRILIFILVNIEKRLMYAKQTKGEEEEKQWEKEWEDEKS